MTTINGFIRSYSAAVKRSERAQQRRARESAKLYKQQLKQQEITDSAKAVANYNEYIEVLKSVHKDSSDTIDWIAIKNESAPSQPTKSNLHEKEAKEKLDNYKPSMMDKLFGSTKRKIRNLEGNITEAAEIDQKEYDVAVNDYYKNLQEWNKLQTISSNVLNRQPIGYKEAIAFFNPFQEINELGSQVDFKFDSDFISVDVKIHNDDVIPDFVLSTTSTGKLSRKTMPVSKFNEIYQDHVCSSVLRVARETLAYLPLKFILINAIGDILNTSTGLLEQQPILSVAIFPETLARLNLDSIDPSDSMRNFVHNIKFSKVNGFSHVTILDASKLLS